MTNRSWENTCRPAAWRVCTAITEIIYNLSNMSCYVHAAGGDLDLFGLIECNVIYTGTSESVGVKPCISF